MKISVVFRMPKEEAEILDALAFRLGISRSKLIYSLVKPCVDKAKDDEAIQALLKLRTTPLE